MITMSLVPKVLSLHLKPSFYSRKNGKKPKANQLESEEEEESSDNDLEVVEALLARKYSKGGGKYKGKIPLIYFSCE